LKFCTFGFYRRHRRSRLWVALKSVISSLLYGQTYSIGGWRILQYFWACCADVGR